MATKAIQEHYSQVQSTMLHKMDQFEQLCPAHVKAERIIASVLGAMTSTPKIMECSRQSLFLAAMTCCQMGLAPNTPLQHCAIVPYKKVATVIPMYKGLIYLAYNTGEIASLDARPGYAGEEFELSYDEKGVRFRHVPIVCPSEKRDENDFKMVYAITRFTNPLRDPVIYPVSREKMDRIRAGILKGKYKPQESPWTTDYLEMALKTAVRRGLKMVPMSPERHAPLAFATAHDEALEVGIPTPQPDTWRELSEQLGVDEPEPEEIDERSKSERLADELAGVDTETGEIMEEDDDAEATV